MDAVLMIVVLSFTLVVSMGIMRDNTKHDIENIIDKKLEELRRDLK